MGSSGWHTTNKYDLWQERRGMSYVLCLRFIRVEPNIALTPDEAIKMGEVLLLWGEKEKDSGRTVLDKVR